MTVDEFELRLLDNGATLEQFGKNFAPLHFNRDILTQFLVSKSDWTWRCIIDCAFVFSNTPEGVDFWLAVGNESNRKAYDKPKTLEDLLKIAELSNKIFNQPCEVNMRAMLEDQLRQFLRKVF
jgi:hypothetical protein